MNLSYLTYASLPSRKAHSIHVMKMCSALAENGHKVTLWYPSGGEGAESLRSDEDILAFYGVRSSFAIRRVPRFPGQLGLYLTGMIMAVSVALHRPQLVISRYLVGSIILSAISSIPSILELHQPVAGGSRMQHRLFRRFLRSRAFHKMVVITTPLKEIFLEEHPIDPDRILVLADGADPQMPALPGQVDDELALSGDRVQVGYFGHLYPGRGVEIIIGMAEACPWADFHIVGGQEEDIKRVDSQCRYLSNVRVHGFITPDRAAHWRMKMDVLVAPYQRKVGIGGDFTTERWMSPLKVFEYMASGKPILCSDIPVLREVLRPEENCLLCPPADVDAWVQALGRIRDEVGLAERLSDCAVEDVNRNYLWTVRAQRMLNEGLVRTIP